MRVPFLLGFGVETFGMVNSGEQSCNPSHARWAFIFWVALFYLVRHMLPANIKAHGILNKAALFCLGLAMFLYEGELHELLCVLPNLITLGSRPQAAARPVPI